MRRARACARAAVWEAGHRPTDEPERRAVPRPPPYALGSSTQTLPVSPSWSRPVLSRHRVQCRVLLPVLCRARRFSANQDTSPGAAREPTSGTTRTYRPTWAISHRRGECQAIAPYQPHISPSRCFRTPAPHRAIRCPSATRAAKAQVAGAFVHPVRLCGSESGRRSVRPRHRATPHAVFMKAARFAHGGGTGEQEDGQTGRRPEERGGLADGRTDVTRPDERAPRNRASPGRG